MVPGFNPDVTAYTAATTDATNTINAAPEDSKSTVTLYLAGKPTASPVTWATGENELRIDWIRNRRMRVFEALLELHRHRHQVLIDWR